MKKKIFLTIIVMCVLTCLFAFSVNAAEPSYADGEWIYAADGVTKITLRDTDGNPLVWYMNGEELKYVRADQTDPTEDVYIKYEISAGGSGFNTSVFSPEKTLKKITIYDNGTEIIGSGSNLAAQKIVLLNLEKLDVDAFNGWLFGNKNGCCPSLRGIYLPSTLRGIGQEGFTNTKLVQIWNLENTKLFYMNACNPASNSTLTQEATNGVIKCPPTMTTPLNIQGTQVVTYIMSPFIDDPKMVEPFHQYFRDCKKLQNIFVPAAAQIGFGEEAFRGTPAQYIVFITGTEQDAIAMRDNTRDRSQGDNAQFKKAEVISYETYMSDKETYDNTTNKVYIVYGYDYCQAFFDGHKMSENTKMQFTSYFNEILFASSCLNEGCSYKGFDTTKTIAPMFTYRGYSVSKFDNGSGHSMVQGFGVNKESIKRYVEITGAPFVFGVIATGNVGGEAIDPMAKQDKVQSKELNYIIHDYFEIKVSGISSAYLDKEIIFCGYVIDGEEVFYLDGEETTVNGEKVFIGAAKKQVAGVSYKDLTEDLT